MKNAIDEYFDLKAKLGEPLIELETETSVNEKQKGRSPKTEVAPKLNKVVEQVTTGYDFQPILKMIREERKRMLLRQTELSQEMADLEIKIAGLNYVEEKILLMTKE